MMALPIAAPSASTATVPDHWLVTETATTDDGSAPVSAHTRRDAANHAVPPVVGSLFDAAVVGEHQLHRLERSADELAAEGEQCHLRPRCPEVDREDELVRHVPDTTGDR